MAEALFLTYFDDHKGQSLLWSRTAGTQNLDGIELQALPSGLHLVEDDTYYFRRTEPASTGRATAEDLRSQLGTVVFRNRALTQGEVDRAGGEGKTRGRLMFGLGILSKNHESSFQFPQLSPLQRAVDAISEGWRVDHTSNDRREWLDRILDPVWTSLEEEGRNRGVPLVRDTNETQRGPADTSIPNLLGLTPDNPIENLVLLSQTLGVSLLSLWKYAAAGRRILFYGPPPLTSICQAAYCTWLMSLRLTALEQRPISVYLGMIGLTDMSFVAGIQHGWVACTSDALYKDKHGIYDLLVDCSGSDILPLADDEVINTAREPVMRAVVRGNGQVSLKYLTYTYSDTVLWNSISPLLQEVPLDNQTATAENSAIWSTAMGTYTYICDICWGLCAFATGTAYGHAGSHADHHSGGYIRLPTDEDPTSIAPAEEEDSFEDLGEDDNGDATTSNDTRVATSIQILKILDHRREHIEKRLAKTVTDTGTPTLSKEDMRQMGLSAWSWVDVEFVRGLHRLRKREPISTGTLGSGLEVEKGWFRKVIGLVGL